LENNRRNQAAVVFYNDEKDASLGAILRSHLAWSRIRKKPFKPDGRLNRRGGALKNRK
jgi:hypothetical protein